MEIDRRISVGIGASQDVYEQLEISVRRKYQKEKGAGRPFSSHLYRRGTGKWVDFVKANMLLGIPLVAYMMIHNIFAKNVKNIYVMGNQDTRAVYAQVKDHFRKDLELHDKQLVFVPEAPIDQLSFRSTMLGFQQAMRKVPDGRGSISQTGHLFFQPADSPLLHTDETLEGLLAQIQAGVHPDIYMSLNAFDLMNFGYKKTYPENGIMAKEYFMGVHHNETDHVVKEGNGTVFNLNSDHVIDFVASMFKVKKGLVRKLFSGKENYLRKARRALAYAEEHDPRAFAQYRQKRKEFLRSVLMAEGNYVERLEKMWKDVFLNTETITGIVKDQEDLTCILEPYNKNPGEVADADTIYEFTFLQALLASDPTVYTLHEKVLLFKEARMPILADTSDVFNPVYATYMQREYAELVGAPFFLNSDGSVNLNKFFTEFPNAETRISDYTAAIHEYNNTSIQQS